MWLITLLSLVGVILNIHKRRECFIVWGITNFIWAVYDWGIGAYAQSALFAVYFCLAVWGLIKWRQQ